MGLDKDRISLLFGDGAWKTHGTEELKPIVFSDGPNGVRKPGSEKLTTMSDAHPSVSFPSEALRACSFDPSLEEEVGQAMGAESRRLNVDVLLGPGLNIKRHPLGGRNFEYYSEDPYLTALMGTSFVKGLQSTGVGASVKHYALNSQETYRFTSDSIADLKTMRDIYLYPFEKVIRDSDPYTLMASYNLINGVYGCDNSYLLKDLLRGEWGYEGCVISDWGASDDPLYNHLHGLDIEMPCHQKRGKQIGKAIKKGLIKEADLLEPIRHVERLLERCASKPDMPDIDPYETAVKAIKQSAVYLRKGGLLPLENLDDVAIIGPYGDAMPPSGGGSSLVNPLKRITLKQILQERGANAEYAPGYRLSEKGIDPDLLEGAREAAKHKKTAIVFLESEKAGEGFDRENWNLDPRCLTLLEAVHEVNQNIIGLLFCPGPVDPKPLEMAKDLLLFYFPGEGFAEALLDILLGEPPSGYLSETWPISLDYPFDFPSKERHALYLEGPYVGCRYFGSLGKKTAFPFGHGNSYGDCRLEGVSFSPNKDGSVGVVAKVKNHGEHEGSILVQAYLDLSSSPLPEPSLSLASFSKVRLAPGEEKTVGLTVPREAFERYIPSLGKREVIKGKYAVKVGISSETLPFCKDIEVDGIEFNDEISYHPLRDEFDKETFVASLPEPLKSKPKKPFDLNSTIGDLDGTLIGKIMKKGIMSVANKAESESDRITIISSGMSAPLRMMTLGGVSEKLAYFLAELGNHRPFKALKCLLRGRKL